MFSARLKEARLSKGLTLKALGTQIGMAESTVSMYEAGKREPDIETIRKISSVLMVSTDYLLGHSDNPNPVDEKPDDINLDTLEFALFGEVRELDDEDKEELLRDARRLRELRELRKLKNTDR